ncbi:alpha/beta hydrolase [Enhydrobacter sp.]|jgi:pimeloyl-ACP methyl ester carboxylesterase|uniref:alpha/beta fold hydrolase n=1 Tax=Enhydrobacter sp. TaxID=1894999 RepID=UPI0026397F1D|nr:alpha/beta hydrolase [Enhydrobacter sp.]WIM14446.1 MAG: Hydrolase, alpha/beta fold family [Enhydrobacter sp.]
MPAVRMKSRLITLKPSGMRIEVAEAGKGRDLLFLHGAGGHMLNDPLLAALATKYRVAAPLLPGYGRSDGEDGLRDMLDFTLHTLDAMAKLELEAPIVVGHSMGGMIAAEMAAIARTEVAKLCLLAPAGLWLDDHPVVDIFSKLPYELPALLFHDAEAGKKLMTAGGGDMNDPEFLKQFLVTNARRLGMAGKILFPIPDRGLAQRLHRVIAKTLIVWGQEDALIPPVYGEAFRKAIPGSKLVKVAKAGHAVGQERPDAVLKAIQAFF